MPLVEGIELTPLEVRALWRRMRRKFHQQGECWIWTGRRNEKDYGQVRVKNRVCKVHRVTFGIFVGPLDDDDGHHVCATRPCGNPAHVQPASPEHHRYRRRR